MPLYGAEIIWCYKFRFENVYVFILEFLTPVRHMPVLNTIKTQAYEVNIKRIPVLYRVKVGGLPIFYVILLFTTVINEILNKIKREFTLELYEANTYK